MGTCAAGCVKGGITIITGILGYNRSNGRYGLLVMDLWKIEGLHCGQSLEVWDCDTGQWISTRLEMHWQAPSFPPKRNDGWYLVGTSFSGTALDGLRVRIP